MDRIILKNPDTTRVYNLWHYSKCCYKIFTHSQATFNMLANNNSFKCCRDNLVDIPTNVIQIEIFKINKK